MRKLTEVYGDRYHEFSLRKDSLPRRLTGKVHYFSSPGRAEIVGNHTDHNHGKAIVSSLSCDIMCCAKAGQDVEIYSAGHRPVHISLSDLSPKKEEAMKSAALARGVLEALSKTGRIGGFTAVTASNIFRGAGVSSSAAFAVLVAEIENAFYRDGTLSPLEKAQAAQYAENVHFLKPCGLLDQCGVALGGINKLDFATPASPAVEPLPALGGYSVILTNTGGSHAGLTSHYAAIKREMGDVAAFFGKQYLREVSSGELYAALPQLRKRVSERAVLRAIHFFEENERVDAAARALQRGDAGAFLAQIAASGESSLKLLQNCFVPGSVSQPVVLALKLSEKILKNGASRMMGGGFTGAVLSFVPFGEEKEFTDRMAKVFGRENMFLSETRSVGATEFTL